MNILNKRQFEVRVISTLTLTQLAFKKVTYRPSVRVKGGMSLRNGMWHGLWNDIIMRNVKYGNWRKEIN